jgi:hypothetical protein
MTDFWAHELSDFNATVRQSRDGAGTPRDAPRFTKVSLDQVRAMRDALIAALEREHEANR